MHFSSTFKATKLGPFGNNGLGGKVGAPDVGYPPPKHLIRFGSGRRTTSMAYPAAFQTTYHWVHKLIESPRHEILELGNNAIDDDGVMDLARWPGLSTVEPPGLIELFITTQSIKSLLDSPHTDNVRHLCIGDPDTIQFAASHAPFQTPHHSLHRQRAMKIDAVDSIFGTIRSVLHGHRVLIAQTLIEHIDQIYKQSPLRCLAEVCPYVEKALEHRTTSKATLALDKQNNPIYPWAAHTPSLFIRYLEWPGERATIETWVRHSARHTIIPFYFDLGPTPLTELFQTTWCEQIEGLIMYGPLTIEVIDVLNAQPELPGFLDLSLLHDNPLELLEYLTITPMIKHINTLHIELEGSREGWTEGHTRCINQFQALDTIVFENYSPTPYSIEGIEQHPNLTNFRQLELTFVTQMHGVFRHQLPHLHTLKLNSCDITPSQLPSHITPRLEHLDFNGNDLSTDDLNAMLSALVNPALRTLKLSNQEINASTIDTLTQTGALISLQDIWINSCTLGESSNELMHQLAGEYSSIRLVDNQLDGNALVTLSNNPHISVLKVLHIQSNWLNTPFTDELGSARWLNTLENLTLIDSRVNDPRIGEVLCAPKTGQLKHIQLNNNALDDAFCALLTANTPKWTEMTLNLSNNPIGPEGIEMLTNWPGLQHVSSLHLTQAATNDDTIQMLASSPYIGNVHTLNCGQLSDVQKDIVSQSRYIQDMVKKTLHQ